MATQEITITTKDGIILVHVDVPMLEETHAQKLLEQVLPVVEQNAASPVLLNMSQVKYMPSMALGALVTLWRKLKDAHQKLILVGLQSPVRTTLATCRLDKLFEFSDTDDEARGKLTR